MGERRGTKGLELWCRKMTEGYPGVKIDNMTTSWRDGLAFCAIIHHFRPDLIDFSKLNKNDIYKNNELAFRIAEHHLGIPALLEPEDMVEFPVPDRLSILTYLSQFYQAFAVTHGTAATRIPAKRPQTTTDHGIVSPASTSPPTKIPYHGTGKVRREPCAKCGLPVFIAERLNVGKLLYHRTCFRCARCNSQLTLANYYETESNEFCCEMCPDEEKIRLSVDSADNSILTRSMSDEEKSALNQLNYVNEPDEYSSQFENALENPSDSSLKRNFTLTMEQSTEFAKARSQFFDSQIENMDSGTDEPPDLPKTKPPILENYSNESSLVSNSAFDSGFPMNKLDSSVNNVSGNTSLSNKFEEVENIVTKDVDKENRSFVKSRTRLFESNSKSENVHKDEPVPLELPQDSQTHTPLDNDNKHSSPDNILNNDVSIYTISDDSVEFISEPKKDSDSVVLVNNSIISETTLDVDDDIEFIDDDENSLKTVEDVAEHEVSDDKKLVPFEQPIVEKSVAIDKNKDFQEISPKEEQEVVRNKSRETSPIPPTEIEKLDSKVEELHDISSSEYNNKVEITMNNESKDSMPVENTSEDNVNEIESRADIKDISPEEINEVSTVQLTIEPIVEDKEVPEIIPEENTPSRNEETSSIKEPNESSNIPIAETLPSENNDVVVPKPRKHKKKLQKKESYPEDLNPFGDDEPIKKPNDSLNPFGDVDEEEEVEKEPPKPIPSPRIRRKIEVQDKLINTPDSKIYMQRISVNPFEDVEEDDEKIESKPPLPTNRPKKVIEAPKISLNPFWSEDEEEDNVKLPVPTPRYSSRVPEPRPRYESGTTTTSSSVAGSISSLSSSGQQNTIRKKKPAPKPPSIIKSDATESGHSSLTSSPSQSIAASPRLTPKNRKTKKAPPPPPSSSSTPVPYSTQNHSVANSPLSISSIRKSGENIDDDYGKEKNAKDEMNRNRQSQNLSIQSPTSSETSSSLCTPNKSTYGKWKRRKGQAPQRPIPQRRSIKALPMGEIRRELEVIEIQQQGLEKQGVMIEQIIREKSENNTNPDEPLTVEVEDLILQLFELVNEKNELFRKQAELMYLRRQQRLEEEHADVEYQIRCLMLQPEANKTDSDKAREEELINRLVDIVERRNEIIECLEMDRVREAQEDDSINNQMNLYTLKREEDKTPVEKPKKEKKKHKITKEKIKEKLHILKDKDKERKVDIDKDVDESETPSLTSMDKDKEKKKKKKFNIF